MVMKNINKKINKRLISFILAGILCFSVFTIIPNATLIVSAGTYNGTCGDNLTWTLDADTGVLNISGEGDMTNNWDLDSNYSAWYNYRKVIKAVILSDGITSIGAYAFWNFNNLTSITITSGVTSIGYRAFFNCSSLTSVTMPNSVTSIGKYAFAGCTSLTSIPIPNNATSIGAYAFASLSLTTITIPNSVTSIGEGAFYECLNLTTVTIPNSVISIGERAFYNCNNLTTITIPDSVNLIGAYAFAGCNSLTVAYFQHSNASTIALAQSSETFERGTFKYTANDFKIIYPANAVGFTTPTWNGIPSYPDGMPASSDSDKGGINYSVAEVIVNGSSSGFSINLTQETLTLAEDYSVVAYSIDGGKKWKVAKSDTFSEKKFIKLLNKDLELALSDKPIDKNTKKPSEGATIVTFAKINKRPKAPKLVVNYSIAASATSLGEWVLTEKNGTKAVKNDVEIGVASGKTVDENGYGVFYEGERMGIPIQALTGSKVTKSVYFIRSAPKVNGTTYTPASKPKKISVTSEQKQTKYKIKVKKATKTNPSTATIKLKKGDIIFGGTIEQVGGNPTTVNSSTANLTTGSLLHITADKGAEILVTDYTGDIIIWKSATAKKPASAKQVLKK